MVDALGRPPNFINIIFYDEELPIQKLLQTTYNALEIDAFRNVPLVFSSHIIDGTLQITAIQGADFQYIIDLLEGKHALQLPVMVLVNN